MREKRMEFKVARHRGSGISVEALRLTVALVLRLSGHANVDRVIGI